MAVEMRADSKLVQALRPSPNHRARKDDEHLKMVVVHGTWMADDEEAIGRLCDPAAEVSCHYYIGRDGKVSQLVSEGRVAYQAGKSRWQIDGAVVENLNGWSLGIELGNRGPFARTPEVGNEVTIRDADWAAAEPYTEAQYAALIDLLRDILARNPEITPARVVGHDDVAPERKSDPGRHFVWQKLVQAGVCVRPL